MNTEWIPAASDRFTPGRGGARVDTIVFHTTTTTMEHAIATFQGGDRKVSAHYIVGLDGRIVQLVSEDDTAWAAGDWAMNLRSINIEHVDDGDWNGVRPDALYTSSAGLVRDINERHGPCANKRHSDVIATGCPDALDVERIIRESEMTGESDMTPQYLETLIDGRVRSLVELDGATRTSIGNRAREIVTGEYGPALERELRERFAAAGSPDIGAIVAASVGAVAAKLAK